MRNTFDSILKLFVGTYFVATSLYCLLTFVPYTYQALIQSPPFAWMPLFSHHLGTLFWLAWISAGSVRHDVICKRTYFAYVGGLAVTGWFVSTRLSAGVQSDEIAYLLSIASLWAPIPLIVLWRGLPPTFAKDRTEPRNIAQFSYMAGALLGVVIALLSEVQSGVPHLTHDARMNPIIWSAMKYAVVAVMLVSLANLIGIISLKFSHPRLVRWRLFGISIFAALCVFSVHVLDAALDLRGWQALVYAASFALALTLLGFAVAKPLFSHTHRAIGGLNTSRMTWLGISATLVLVMYAVPMTLVEVDWNGVLQGTLTFIGSVVLSYCVFNLLPARRLYPITTIVAAPAFAFAIYSGLEARDLVWSWPTDNTNENKPKTPASERSDASFGLSNRLIDNSGKTCDEFCRVLLLNTEVHAAQARVDLKLVDQLVPTHQFRPHIFVFVIDSLRPDYLGAYNPRVAFTPNLDALARDGIAIRNAFTPYAGTSLAEPAIWAGALMLHAHYMQPFRRVNSLEKLMRADGYEIIVSYDEILSRLLTPSEDITRLDLDKALWPNLEACSTIQQAEATFARRANAARPIFFYAQPKNVHSLARNAMPNADAANWHAIPGFQRELSLKVHQIDDCLGGFFDWLKAHELYDDSLIIVTSDHGDATGELGRNGHSVVLYPEIMRIPLIVHLPMAMQGKYLYDDHHISALIDITPSLYYLLGHRPIISNPLFGHPLLVETQEELQRVQRSELFLASDAHAIYGILADDGRYFYAIHASPSRSYLYDLSKDPQGVNNILTDALKARFDQKVLAFLHQIADFYGYSEMAVE